MNDDRLQQIANLVRLVSSLREEYFDLASSVAAQLSQDNRNDLTERVAKVSIDVQDRLAEIVGVGIPSDDFDDQQ